MPGRESENERLIELARVGDRNARERLLIQHRTRLRKMIAVRMDPRLAIRVDPSDIVQDTLMEASRRLSEYLHDVRIPFYPWLRNLAAQRLIQLQRKHIHAKRRSVNREQAGAPPLSGQSSAILADCILSGERSSPLSRIQKVELLERVRTALDELPERDREILVLRYLEQFSIEETAAVLNINKAAVKMRHLRALDRLRALFQDESGLR